MVVMTAQRQLIVMRHAKAGELPGGPDAERALRPRGRRDAAAAGGWLTAQQLTPDLVFCSGARRARQTWQYVGAELAAEPQVIVDPRLYGADAHLLLGIFAQAPPEARTLMYVGHNPAAVDLVEILTGQLADLRTASIAVIGLAVSWPALADGDADGAGELVATWLPGSQ
jgi:phosphohistidine phosphatase